MKYIFSLFVPLSAFNMQSPNYHISKTKNVTTKGDLIITYYQPYYAEVSAVKKESSFGDFEGGELDPLRNQSIGDLLGTDLRTLFFSLRHRYKEQKKRSSPTQE